MPHKSEARAREGTSLALCLLPSPRPFGLLYFASCQCLGFHLQIGFSVDVGGIVLDPFFGGRLRHSHDSGVTGTQRREDSLIYPPLYLNHVDAVWAARLTLVTENEINDRRQTG